MCIEVCTVCTPVCRARTVCTPVCRARTVCTPVCRAKPEGAVRGYAATLRQWFYGSVAAGAFGASTRRSVVLRVSGCLRTELPYRSVSSGLLRLGAALRPRHSQRCAHCLRGRRSSQRWVRTSGRRTTSNAGRAPKAGSSEGCRCLHEGSRTLQVRRPLRFRFRLAWKKNVRGAHRRVEDPTGQKTPWLRPKQRPLGQSAFIIGDSRKCSFPLVTRIFSRTPSLNASCPSRLMG